MIQCPACAAEAPDDSRFCPACATSLDSATSPTQTNVSLTGPPSSGTTSRAGRIATGGQARARFLPGSMLAGRYRIIGLLGRGGMGEVYRADDLKLGQPVALKFLPAELEEDPGRLERLLNEVKTARQVSHPNVCRVNDIGEVQGDPSRPGSTSHFLSMEYVDGENLASLLLQVGRFPGDKAAQIARQICAGLAAAHERGILHRDLKPANVMIDGRGQVRLTDFGLAGLADAFEGDEVRVGTPAYMAPEQLAGHEVSVKSDLYSLGLVLYELFTGRRPFRTGELAELRRLLEETSPASPSTLVDGLDPAAERAILHCLEREPHDRPGSALAVAAALPGGDPLAAALAAGETPSPEMVAAAGPRGGLRAGVATLCLAATVVGVVAAAALSDAKSYLACLPLEKSFEALKENGREIASRLGYGEEVADRYASFGFDLDDFMHLAGEYESDGDWSALSRPGQHATFFFYRQSPRVLVPTGLGGGIGVLDPDPREDDISLRLDLAGRLAWLRATPPRTEWSDEEPPPVDWSAVFEFAGLDLARFEPTTPRVLPGVFADSRAAWTGTLPDAGDREVRIEAAGYRGKPVYFNPVVSSDSLWSEEKDSEQPISGSLAKVVGIVLLSLLGLVAGAAVFLAVRNLKVGRGDRRGATRLALSVFGLTMLHWLVTAHHVASLFGEVYRVFVTFSYASALSALTWVLYVALEPYLRRIWPEALVSWNRLLAGRFRDPLVGRDVLLGCALFAALHLLFTPVLWLIVTLDLLPPLPSVPLSTLRGGRFALGELFRAPLVGLSFALGMLMLFLLMRLLTRRTWGAMVLFSVLNALWAALQWSILAAGIRDSAAGGAFAVGLLVGAINGAVIGIVITRFGLLATIAGFTVSIMLNNFPLTANVSAPYFGTALVGALAVFALALAGYRASQVGRPVVPAGLPQPEAQR